MNTHANIINNSISRSNSPSFSQTQYINPSLHHAQMSSINNVHPVPLPYNTSNNIYNNNRASNNTINSTKFINNTLPVPGVNASTINIQVTNTNANINNINRKPTVSFGAPGYIALPAPVQVV